MFLIFLTTIIMEDSLTPSLRVMALGADFALIVEDVLIDVQYNPAKLGDLKRTAIFLKPQWQYYSDHPKINIGIFLPTAYRNVGLGLLSSYAHSKNYGIYNYENSYQSAETTYYLLNQPYHSFFVAFPFIKENGFFGIKLTAKKDDREHSDRFHYVNRDTNYYVQDTSIVDEWSFYYQKNVDNNNLWSIKCGQYLPFTNSAFNFVFAVSRPKPVVVSYDSSFSSSFYQYIYHYYYYDSTREVRTNKTIYENYTNRKEEYDIWTGNFGLNLIKYLNQGTIKFLLQGGVIKGEINTTENYFHRDFYETTDEYTSPDTSYTTADTLQSIDSSANIGTSSILYDFEEAGIGLEKLAMDNINLLIGLKLCRRNENIETDSSKEVNANYKIVMPFGSEFYITQKFCLRGGISLFYDYSSNKISNSGVSKITNDRFGVSRSFGMGINLRPKLWIDLFASGSNIASIESWQLEGCFTF